MVPDRRRYRRRIGVTPRILKNGGLLEGERPLEGFSRENREKDIKWRRDMSPPRRFKKIQKRRNNPVFDEPGRSQIKRGRLMGEETENRGGNGA
jgi:hypothetical protein